MRRILRSLARHPGGNSAAIVMGAIGIGLLTLGLAFTDAARWRALPFPGAREALVLSSTHGSTRETREGVRWSFPRLQYVRDHAKALALITSWTPTSLSFGAREEPLVISGEFVSRHYFALLDVRPSSGRTFLDVEDTPGAPVPVVLVSESFRIARQLAGDPVGIGTSLLLNGQNVTVIGVMPATFRGLSDAADLWLPAPMAPVLTYPEYLTTNQDFITLLARPRTGSTLADARREADALATAAYRAIPSDDVGPEVRVRGDAESLGTARVRTEGRRASTLIMAGSSILFLLTTANLVALMLGRVLARQRETAVTIALGATGHRVWRAQVAEGVVLVVAGALLALAAMVLWLRLGGAADPLAAVGRGAFGTFSSLTAGWRLMGWWALATLLTTGMVATIPAWWSRRHTTLEHLREGAHGSSATGLSFKRPGAAAGILVAQGTLAVLLLTAAAQLLESYRRMQDATIGVSPAPVLTFELQPPESAVPPAAAPAFIDRVLAAIRDVPGVQSASVDGGAPLAGSASAGLHIVGRPDDPVTGPPGVLRHYVGPEHFATLGIPLLAGRTFTDGDHAAAPRVVVISESAARTWFPNGTALGQRVWFDGSTLTSPDSSAEVVGVVGDVKYQPLLAERTTASFYTPYAQFTYAWRVYFVKVSGDPRTMQRVIADAVHRVAPGLPLLNVRPLDDILAPSRRIPHNAARGMSVLAVLGLALAVCGIWAIVSHATTLRARDMAIRAAHGATTSRVMRHVLTEGLLWPLTGLLLGALLSVGMSGLLRSLLYGITPGDPRMLLAGTVVFLLSATGACLVPAWRASQVSPMLTLRSD